MEGLSSKEVETRVKAGKVNTPVQAPFKTNWQIIRGHTFTYFNGVFVVLAIILASVGSWRDLTFLLVILCNTLIGIIQEFRVKKVLEKVTVMSQREAVVIRDGEEQNISTSDIVVDDIIKFTAGNQIPADAVVISGSAAVNEALLTGEADDVQKTAKSDLLSGSFVVSGECYAKVTKVGADSYASKLTLKAKAIKTGEQSEIIRSLNKIVRMAGFAIIPIGIALFCQQYFMKGASVTASVQGMAAAIIGMIPEGLFLLASATLAISAMRLAKNKVLVHEMKCIETLARVDVLCADKTGTITSPDMVVHQIIPLEPLVNEADDDSTEDASDDFLNEILAVLSHSLPADNATMQALKNHFEKPSKSELTDQIFPFSPVFKYSGVIVDRKGFVIGAPEFILKDDYEKYKSEIESFSRKGYRALIFGEYEGDLDGGELKKKVKPLAIVTLENPVRENAKETFSYFAEQGVDIKVISGDNPLTVSEVARQAGIKNANKFIDARKLEKEKDYLEAVEKYTVFGRVLPEQKQKLVKALQAKGHTVAMTGDGVNDVLALKDADCGIAMASGSDAAVHAAQLVLLESDFSKMPSVVYEGRRVVNNLERSGSLFIVKNVFSFITAVFAILLSFKYPLLPNQVSMVTMWCIGIPSFFLALMPNKERIKGRFITNILAKAVPGGLTDVIFILLAILFCQLLNVPEDQISTVCTIIFASVGVGYLLRVSRPFSIYSRTVWTVCVLGLIGTAVFSLVVTPETLPVFFKPLLFTISNNLSMIAIVICLVLGIMVLPTLWLNEKLVKKTGVIDKIVI